VTEVDRAAAICLYIFRPSAFGDYLSQDAFQPLFLLLSITMLAHVDIVGKEVRSGHLRMAQWKLHTLSGQFGHVASIQGMGCVCPEAQIADQVVLRLYADLPLKPLRKMN
jgi:hypothetical protein